MKIGKVLYEYSAMEHGELDLVIGKTIKILQKVKKVLSQVIEKIYKVFQMSILYLFIL